jgi:TonB family protein
MFMLASNDGFDYRERPKKAKKRQLTIDLGPEPMTAETAGAALSKVFVSGKAEFVSEVPDYWKTCVRAAFRMETDEPGFNLYPLRNGCRFGSRMLTALSISSSDLGSESDAGAKSEVNEQGKATLQLQKPAVKVGGGVSAPKAVHTPDPQYSVEAREAKINGTVVFGIVVDSTGLPKEIEVIRPLGYGLDEQGVFTLESWRFEPAKKDGNPVAVHINVEVQYRLW